MTDHAAPQFADAPERTGLLAFPATDDELIAGRVGGRPRKLTQLVSCRPFNHLSPDTEATSQVVTGAEESAILALAHRDGCDLSRTHAAQAAPDHPRCLKKSGWGPQGLTGSISLLLTPSFNPAGSNPQWVLLAIIEEL